MKKWIAGLVSVVLMVFITACTVEKTEPQDVTLVVYSFYSAERIERVKEVAERYIGDDNTRITVEFKSLHNDYDRLSQLESLYNGNEQVDILWMPTSISHSELALLNYVYPLSEFTGNTYLDDYYIDLRQFHYGESLYALPLGWNEYVVYYNKEIFDRYQVNYPSIDWSYEDLANTARKLNDADNQIIGLHNGAYLFYTVGGAYGGTTFNEQYSQLTLMNDNALAGYEFWADQFQTHKIDGRVADDFSRGLFVNPDFSNGNVAMMVGSTEWFALGLNKDIYGFVPLPRGAARQQGLSELDSLAISSKSGHKEEAFRLIEFLTGDVDSASALVQSGFTLPLLKEERLYEDWRRLFGDEHVDTLNFILQNNVGNFGFPIATPGYSNVLMKVAPLLYDYQTGLYSGRLKADAEFARKIETINAEWLLEQQDVWEPLKLQFGQ